MKKIFRLEYLILSFIISVLLASMILLSCMKEVTNPVTINTNIPQFKIGRKYNYIVKDKKLTIINTKDFSQAGEETFESNINSFVIDESDDVILGLDNGKILHYNPATTQITQIDKFFEPIKLVKLSFDGNYIEIISINNAILLINRKDLSMSMGSYKENVKDINFDFDEKRLYIEFENRIEILDIKTKHILKKIPLK